VFLVLELEYLKSSDEEAVAVVASLPGRDGAMVRSWRMLHGALTTEQAEDLTAYCQRLAMDACLTFHGVQGTLPMG
jgi:hypothetical protein